LTERELRKLTRLQLLELLILQTEETENLQKQLDELKMEKELEAIKISNLGSIAEASIQISNVFKATQQAADLYLEAAKKEADSIVSEARVKAKKIVSDAEKLLLIDKETKED